jgi:hypothetical protein
MVFAAEDLRVDGGGGSELVEPDGGAFMGEAGIVDAFKVRTEVCSEVAGGG